MKKSVFISSTYLDLIDERKKVWEALKKFEVTVRGMEEFGARSTNPLETCLSEIEQSDIYVGIIGMRFGTEDKTTKKSYTQLEYEKAVSLGKEILIYLVDEDNYLVHPAVIQKDKIKKLELFKTVLKENHTIDTFANIEDLITKLNRQFQTYLKPKDKTPVVDDYENTKKVLDMFFLVPKAYSGREIKLKVKFTGTPKPANKNLCNLFKYEFGKTVVSGIKVIHPTIDYQNFTHIIIEYSFLAAFLKLDRTKEHEIYANLLFKEEKLEKLTTEFKDKMERVYYNNDYDGDNDMPYDYDPEEYRDILKVGEGQISLEFGGVEV